LGDEYILNQSLEAPLCSIKIEKYITFERKQNRQLSLSG